MTELATKVLAARIGETVRWPLAFKIQPPSPQESQGLLAFGMTSKQQKPKRRWWSHRLYRGPNNEPVQILYSKTKADSEILAQKFLEEKIVGFDMEWPWDDWKRPNRLQNKIGLIQVATEDKVALFHIGLHAGETTDDIIAPSLKKLIESPAIGKIGVCVLNADFARLSRYFKLKPKAAVELSHLHRLVVFGGREPKLVSTKMTSLANQVQHHLGHELYKGNVRTSNWSKPLSQEQINYAASDAYAGIMLYHCMNYKRLQMKPVPPLPIHADRYMDYKLAGVRSLYLEPKEEGGKIMTSAFFFGVQTAKEDLSKSKKAARQVRRNSKEADAQSKSAPGGPQPKTFEPMFASGPSSQALYDELCRWRKTSAERSKQPLHCITSKRTLFRISCKRPLNTEALSRVKGIGKMQQERYGSEWLAIVSSFVTKNGLSPLEAAASTMPKLSHAPSSETAILLPSTPDRTSRSRRTVRLETPESSPAFGTPPLPCTPQLHTGLSLKLAETSIGPDSLTADDSDDSLPSLDFGLPSGRRTSGHKRKRTESPPKAEVHNSSQKLQDILQPYRYEEGISENQPLKRSPRVKTSASERAVIAPAQTEPLTPRSNIFRNKLLAFSKLVTTRTRIGVVGTTPIVSNETLELIARRPPRTREELRKTPGIESLFHACVDAKMDLLEKINKFAPVRNT